MYTGMCMSVSNHFDDDTGVLYCLGGFEDGSILIWDTRNVANELDRLKLFTEPGVSIIARLTGYSLNTYVIYFLLSSIVYGC